jgi:predicted tellurium resistance membrane protein TerC
MLTALGVLLAALGLGNASGLIEELLSNLDVIWDAVLVIVGTIVSIVGFFRNKERFKS